MQGMQEPMVQIFRNGVQVNRKPPTIIKTIEISLKQAYFGIKFPLEIERWIREINVRRMEKEKLYVDIPMGTDDGEIILLRNKGNVDNSIGDVKLHIKVINNTGFIRDGLDLLLNKGINLKEALLGFNFEIEHLSGKSYKINNMNGTIIKPYYKKTIPNLGMVRNGIKGNLIISFEVEFPKILTDDQKEALGKIL
jgi:DnaJ-class molecular chaperone